MPGAVLQTLCAFSDIVTVKVKIALTETGSSVQLLDYQHSHCFDLHVGQHYKASLAKKRRCMRTTQEKKTPADTEGSARASGEDGVVLSSLCSHLAVYSACV